MFILRIIINKRIIMKLIKHVMNDGGRADSGYKGQVGDCVLRSIVIASGKTIRKSVRN